MPSKFEMNVKLPDDQIVRFRNLSLKESDEQPEEAQESAGKKPEIVSVYGGRKACDTS